MRTRLTILPLGLLLACGPASVKLGGDDTSSTDTGGENGGKTDDTGDDSGGGDNGGDTGGGDNGGDTGGGDNGGDTGGGDNGGGDTGDNGGGDTDPPAEPVLYSGETTATIDILNGSDVLYSQACSGELEVLVDTSGVVTGAAVCSTGDWSGTYAGEISGTVSGGTFTGEWTVDVWGSPLVLGLSGTASPSRFEASFSETFDWIRVTGDMAGSPR